MEAVKELKEEIRVLANQCSVCGWCMDTVCPNPSCGIGRATVSNHTVSYPKSMVEKWFKV